MSTSLAFCSTQVEPHLDYDRALYRGDWSWVSALMEHRRAINGPLFRQIANPVTWSAMRDALVPELDRAGIYVPHNDGTTISASIASTNILTAKNIAWPRTKTGRLSTESKVFENIAKGHPELEDLRQLRHIRDKMRAVDLAVGDDDRNRTVLMAVQGEERQDATGGEPMDILARGVVAQSGRAGPGHGALLCRLFLDGVPGRGGEIGRCADAQIL